MKFLLAVALIFGFCLISLAVGHQCFQCDDGIADETCNGDESPVTCDEMSSQQYCVLVMYVEPFGHKSLVRGCMSADKKCNPGETVYVAHPGYSVKKYIRCCEGDRCNDPELMSSSNKLTNQNFLFAAMLLGFVYSAVDWSFN